MGPTVIDVRAALTICCARRTRAIADGDLDEALEQDRRIDRLLDDDAATKAAA